MKRLLGPLLVMGMVGCGTSDNNGSADEPVLWYTCLDTGKRVRFTAAAELAQLNDLDSLQELLLIGPINVDLVHLKGRVQLQWLGLHGTHFTDTGFVHREGLTGLEKLWIRNTGVTDEGLAHIQELTSLRYLVLDDTKVTDAGVAELQTALPNCKISK